MGAAIGGIGFLGGLWVAIPEEYREAAKLVGTYQQLDNLNDIYPPVFKVGIVGLSSAGKTTLLRYFCRIRQNNLKPGKTSNSTQELYVYIYALNIPEAPENKSARYLAFIDGAGEQYADQFTVAEASDFLCVVIDHDKNNNNQLEKSRLKEQEEFLKQMSRHLQNKREKNRLNYVHFLLNKRDCWENNADKEELKKWFDNQVKQWEIATFVTKDKLSNCYHSNEKPEDINNFEEKVLNILTEMA
jgi:ABC-type cobalamin/Fe3+-siderophores transport system ATPase subunit